LTNVRGSRAVGAVIALSFALAVGCTSTPVPSPTSSGGPPSLSPTGRPTPTPVETPQATGDVLPTPATTDVVLLVADANSLTAREQQWLTDLSADFGRVDALAYADATAQHLTAYFTVFVIDRSTDLDVAALQQAYAAGLSIHLVGAAADYQAQVAGSLP
jgi:hypothetical protein